MNGKYLFIREHQFLFENANNMQHTWQTKHAKKKYFFFFLLRKWCVFETAKKDGIVVISMWKNVQTTNEAISNNFHEISTAKNKMVDRNGVEKEKSEEKIVTMINDYYWYLYPIWKTWFMWINCVFVYSLKCSHFHWSKTSAWNKESENNKSNHHLIKQRRLTENITKETNQLFTFHILWNE